MAAICGAKAHGSGKPCRLPAGWGTDHPGRGRCKLHGGASHGAPPGNKNARKHGAYETVIRDRLTPEERAIFDAVPADESLREELRVLRFKLARLLEPVEREELIGVPGVGVEKAVVQVDEVTKAKAIARLVQEIRAIVQARSGHEAGGAIDALVDALARSRAKAAEAESGGGEDDV